MRISVSRWKFITISQTGSGSKRDCEEGFGSDYVSNGALTCLSNIIKENEDKTWTIVSANDETQMGLDHGWHYETITFLRNMEYMNKDTKGKMDSDVPDVLLGTGI